MSWNQIPRCLLAMTLAIAGTGHAAAQTNLDDTAELDREGVTVSPDNLTKTDVSSASNLRPDRPERDEFPPEVQDRIVEFRHEAREYLAQRQALKKRLEGANDTERALIRRRIEELRRKWLAEARAMRREFRERQRELRDKLPDYHEVLDSARNDALQQAKESLDDSKPAIPGVE